MTNAELLQLDPQHIAELADCYTAFEFDDVEIVAHEVSSDSHETPWSLGYAVFWSKLIFDSVYRGKNKMHAIFHNDADVADGTFYCVSYAHHRGLEDRIIFKLIRHS